MRVDLAWCGEGQPYPDRTVASRIDGGLAINLAAPVDFLPCADAIADTEPHHSIIALQDAVRVRRRARCRGPGVPD